MLKRIKLSLLLLTLTTMTHAVAGKNCECIKQNLPKGTDTIQYVSLWNIPLKVGAKIGDFMDECFGTYDKKYSRFNQLCSQVDMNKILTLLPDPIQNAKECLKGRPEKIKQLNSIQVNAEYAQLGQGTGEMIIAFTGGNTLVHAIPVSLTSANIIKGLSGKGLITIGDLITGIKYGIETKHLVHIIHDYELAVNKMTLETVYDSACLSKKYK